MMRKNMTERTMNITSQHTNNGRRWTMTTTTELTADQREMLKISRNELMDLTDRLAQCRSEAHMLSIEYNGLITMTHEMVCDRFPSIIDRLAALCERVRELA
jgi:hypothetical protein